MKMFLFKLDQDRTKNEEFNFLKDRAERGGAGEGTPTNYKMKLQLLLVNI